MNKVDFNLNPEYKDFYIRKNNNLFSYTKPVGFGNKKDVFTSTTTKIDKSNDGKFSIDQAAKNFGKGLISPITTMFSSTKNFVMGIGMIATGSLLIAATGGAIAPFMVATGVGMGIIQAGKTAYKFIKAKNGDDVEKAFYDAGAVTSTLGLSVIGAKSSLKQANIDTKNMSAVKATIECFKNTPKSLKTSGLKFTSGEYKANIVNVFKIPSKIRKLKTYSKKLHNNGAKGIDECINEIKSILPDELKDCVKGRVKDSNSIYDKLVKKIKNGEKISNYNQAHDSVRDLVGTRLVIDKPTPEKINKLVYSLVKAIENGDIEIVEIENFRGKNSFPYLNEDHIELIKIAASKKGKNIFVLEGPESVKKSGYTTTQMNIKHKNGLLGEFQIRGPKVEELAEVEHIFYDIKKGKDITKGLSQLEKLFKPVKQAIKDLTEPQFDNYQDYLNNMYDFARRVEMNYYSVDPRLPNGIDPVLSFEKLSQIKDQYKIILKNSSQPKNVNPIIPGSVYSGIRYSVKETKK